MKQSTKTDWSKPIDVTTVDIAFPALVSHLMPEYSKIPDEFREGHSKWNRFFSDMFYSGIKNLNLKPREGVDKATAIRHIRCVAGSYAPEHEHKEAAVAYLMSLWFEDSSTWERAK